MFFFCVRAGSQSFLVSLLLEFAVICKQSLEHHHGCVWNYRCFLFGFPALASCPVLWAGCAAPLQPDPDLSTFSVWVCFYLKASLWTRAVTHAQAWLLHAVVDFEAQVEADPLWPSKPRGPECCHLLSGIHTWCIAELLWGIHDQPHHFAFLGLLKCPYFNGNFHLSCFLGTQIKKRKTKFIW